MIEVGSYFSQRKCGPFPYIYQAPLLKGGLRGKALQFTLFLCLHSWSPHQNPPFPTGPPKLVGWLEGFISLI